MTRQKTQPSWLKKHAAKLLQLRDKPEAVAVGVAAGMFFGFTPLFGLKTLLAIGVTWLLRGSKVAAAIAVTFHDVLLPIAPVLLRWEYDLGFWLMSHPHELPPHLHLHHMETGSWLRWSTFLTVGRPVLLGSVVLAAPAAFIAYYVVRWILLERQKLHGRT